MTKSNPVVAPDSFFRHPFSRYRVEFKSDMESMTHQSHAESCDINKIIAQYDRTGLIPPDPRGRDPQYADVSDLNRDLTSLIIDSEAAGVEYRKIQQAKRAAARAASLKEKAEFEAFKASQSSPPPAVPASSS